MKAIKQEYADRHFRDDESSDMLSIIEKGLKMDAAQIFGGQSLWPIHDGTFRVMYETIGDNKDPQTLVDERKKAARNSWLKSSDFTLSFRLRKGKE